VALLPTTSMETTKSRIEEIQIARKRGNTIGMASIGDACDRRIWMNLHWFGEAETITIRLQNLFDTGTNAEDFMIKDLERIGIVVADRQAEHWGFEKHEHGYDDGAVLGVIEAPKTWHLLEMKTHNQNNFNKLVKQGVKRGFPKHYAQCQRYMRERIAMLKEHGLPIFKTDDLQGSRLQANNRDFTRCLYMGYNKNDSQYYFERIEYDKSFADDLYNKARDLIIMAEPPARQYEKSFFECKFCHLKELCHDVSAPAINCRTCKHVDLAQGGVWDCNLHKIKLSREKQLVGCDKYEAMEFVR